MRTHLELEGLGCLFGRKRRPCEERMRPHLELGSPRVQKSTNMLRTGEGGHPPRPGSGRLWEPVTQGLIVVSDIREFLHNKPN